jgi:uncharacterized membrane protein
LIIDRARLIRFRDDDSGAVAIIVALLLTVFMGFAAFGVDYGLLIRDKTRLQGTADLAAISAVADLPAAPARATQVTSTLHDLPPEITAIRYGRYIPDPALPPPARFVELPDSDSSINAIRLDLRRPTALTFAASFLPQDDVMLQASATAMQARAASFSLSSGLLRLERGAVNALLRRSLGTQVTLSVMDHAALLSSRANLLDIFGPLGTELDLTAANYRDILDLSLPLPALLNQIGAAQTPGAAAVLGNLAAIAPTDTVGLRDLITLTQPNLGLVLNDFVGATEVSALELLVAALDIVSENRAVDLQMNVAIPGLLQLQTMLLVQERPLSSGWVAVGEENAALHTAQTRLRSDLHLAPNLLNGLPLGVSVLAVRLPIYLELANARATLTEVNCRPDGPDTPIATFATGTGLRGTTQGPHVAELFLGSFTPAQFTAPGGLRAVDLQYADILDVALEVRLLLLTLRVPLLTLQARSHVAVGTSQSNQITFTTADLANGPASKRIATQNLLTSSVSSLLGNADIRVKPGQGLLDAAFALLINQLIAILPTRLVAGLLTPVDLTLNEVMKTAGLELGTAELTLHAVHCQRPRLMR